MSEIGETIELVFPYPYRFLRALCSRRYRERVGQLYRDNNWRWVATDIVVSGFFAGVELLLVGVVLYALFL